MRDVKKAEKTKAGDDVSHAPESGEPTESSSRARQQSEQRGGPIEPAKPSNSKVGEDRESGQTDAE